MWLRTTQHSALRRSAAAPRRGKGCALARGALVRHYKTVWRPSGRLRARAIGRGCWARPGHICTGTGLTLATSAPRLGSPPAHSCADWPRSPLHAFLRVRVDAVREQRRRHRGVAVVRGSMERRLAAASKQASSAEALATCNGHLSCYERHARCSGDLNAAGDRPWCYRSSADEEGRARDSRGADAAAASPRTTALCVAPTAAVRGW